MADIVGSTEAFLHEARAALERMQRIPGLPAVKKQARFIVSHPLGKQTIIEGSLNDRPSSRRTAVSTVINGSIWQYRVSGLGRDMGIALCIAVARRFGDLDKAAALTLVLGLNKKYQTTEIMKELFLL